MTVAVAGVGESGPALEDPRSIPELVLDAVEQALQDARLGFDDLDAAVTASVDLLDGLTASNIAVTEVVGAVLGPETRIAADGLLAAIHGACLVRAGVYETVLVVAHGKASLGPYWQLTSWALDPIYLQPLGLDFLACAGLQARTLAEGDAGAEERWAGIAARRRRAAAPHGVAPACAAEDVLASPVVASPLRREACAPLADGATAVVLRAAGLSGPGVHIGGVGFDLSPHALGERELTEWDGLRRAWTRALRTHGKPRPRLDVAEPSCLFPHEEELFRRALELDPGTEVSPGGGLFAGFVPVAAGLSRLVAVARALRRSGGPRAGVAHGAWGPAGQGQAVAILEAA